MTHIYNFVMKCTKQQSFNCDTYLANLSFRIKFCRIFFYLHFVEKWNRGCVDYLLTHVQLVKWCFISLLLYKAFDWPFGFQATTSEDKIQNASSTSCMFKICPGLCSFCNHFLYFPKIMGMMFFSKKKPTLSKPLEICPID